MTDRGATEQGHGEPATPLSLLERARARDEKAWHRLVTLYQPLVLFWCGRGGVPSGDTEDVAQEVFAAVSRGLGSFRHDRKGDTFRGWLRVVTRRQVLMYFRRHEGRAVAEGGAEAWERLQEVPAEAEDGEEAQMQQVYQRALDAVRGEFEEKTWQAFWLTAIEGRSPQALAAELGISAGAIRQAKSRVLRRIREELGELLE